MGAQMGLFSETFKRRHHMNAPAIRETLPDKYTYPYRFKTRLVPQRNDPQIYASPATASTTATISSITQQVSNQPWAGRRRSSAVHPFSSGRRESGLVPMEVDMATTGRSCTVCKSLKGLYSKSKKINDHATKPDEKPIISRIPMKMSSDILRYKKNVARRQRRKQKKQAARELQEYLQQLHSIKEQYLQAYFRLQSEIEELQGSKQSTMEIRAARDKMPELLEVGRV
ncbi:hypothetical protein BGZ94_005129 [Podila epigama]|nr:hypothetical protein BGZ94_005129 [Podila epigama]